MIQTMIVVMSVMLLAYAAAWIFSPALRELFEAPKDDLLDNGDLLYEKHIIEKHMQAK